MSLFEALKNVTKEDLDKCIERIKEIEAELAGMKAARRLIETRLGIEHPRLSNFKGRRPRKAAEDASGEASGEQSAEPQQYTATERHRLRAKEYLMANGPTHQAALAKRCDIPAGSITAVLKHPWFAHTSRGVELTRSLHAEPS